MAQQVPGPIPVEPARRHRVAGLLDNPPPPKTVLLASRDPALVVRMRRALASSGDRFHLVGVVDPMIERTLVTWCGEADVIMIGSNELLRLVHRDVAASRDLVRQAFIVVLMQEQHLLKVVAELEDRVGILFCERDEEISTNAIDVTLNGYVAFPAPLLRRLADNEIRRNIADRLSTGERAILGCMAEALPNRAIADRTGFSETRVKSMVSLLIRKLHLRNRTALAIFAASCAIHHREG